MNHPKAPMKQLVAAVEKRSKPGEEKKSFWTRIGVAYGNKDGSWNLRFDYLPARPEITVQLRDFNSKDGDRAEDEAA